LKVAFRREKASHHELFVRRGCLDYSDFYRVVRQVVRGAFADNPTEALFYWGSSPYNYSLKTLLSKHIS